MTETSQESVRQFWALVEKRRATGINFKPLDIARMAVEAGLKAPEALQAIRLFSGVGDVLRDIGASEAEAPLRAFLEGLGAHLKADEILEISEVGPVLVQHYWAASGVRAPCAYVTEDRYLHEAVKFVAEAAGGECFRSFDDLGARKYDLIVCRPPAGTRPKGVEEADGFGGETVRRAAYNLRKKGAIVWVAARGAAFHQNTKKTFEALRARGFSCTAALDLPTGILARTSLPAVAFIFEATEHGQRFVTAVREVAGVGDLVKAFRKGPRTRSQKNRWAWLEEDDRRLFMHIEQEQALKQLRPRGKVWEAKLRDLLSDTDIKKVAKLGSSELDAREWVFLPEYAASNATSNLDDQSVSHTAVFALPVDTGKVDPHFLARLLNSPYGRRLRSYRAHGTREQLALSTVLDLDLPLPSERSVQDKIGRLSGELASVRNEIEQLRTQLDQQWSELDQAEEKIETLKGAFNLDYQIKEWWRTLPYPLASVYRHYAISAEPRDQFEALLHFFELTAIFLSQVGVSFVGKLHSDKDGLFEKWFGRENKERIERPDFGYWCDLSRWSLKAVNQIVSDPDRRAQAEASAGPDMLWAAAELSELKNGVKPLDRVRQVRNRWHGHGGRPTQSTYAQQVQQMQEEVRELFDHLNPVIKKIWLVRPINCEIDEARFEYDVELLVGSEPRFARARIDSNQRVWMKGELAFWLRGTGALCHAVPFVRVEAPSDPARTAVYAFNRVESPDLRWVSYESGGRDEILQSESESRLPQMLGLSKR